jgi:hypothetical protein
MELFQYFNFYIAVPLYDTCLQNNTDEVMLSHLQIKESDKQSESLPANFESGNIISNCFILCLNIAFQICNSTPPAPSSPLREVCTIIHPTVCKTVETLTFHGSVSRELSLNSDKICQFNAGLWSD